MFEMINGWSKLCIRYFKANPAEGVIHLAAGVGLKAIAKVGQGIADVMPSVRQDLFSRTVSTNVLGTPFENIAVPALEFNPRVED